jgi:hypothetical protein
MHKYQGGYLTVRGTARRILFVASLLATLTLTIIIWHIFSPLSAKVTVAKNLLFISTVYTIA